MESKGNKEILIVGISAFIFLMLTVILKIPITYTLLSVICSLRAYDPLVLYRVISVVVKNIWST